MGRCRINITLFTTVLALWNGGFVPSSRAEDPSQRSFERDESKFTAELEVGEEIEGDLLSDSVTAGFDLTPFTCENIADTAEDRVSNTNRFRGNVYRVQSSGLLHHFAFELDFVGEADLYFTVLRKIDTIGNLNRVRPDIVVTVIGTGRGFYGTPEDMVPIQLQPGTDYILGLAWGPRPITRLRDSLQYPLDFSHGTTRGNVNVDLIGLQGGGPPLFVPSVGLILATVSTGALGMNLCFEPEPGACCCVGQSSCLQRLKSECEDLGGYFRGERQPCSVCRCGACCKPCRAECENDVEFLECALDTVRGDWQGENTQCSDTEVTCPVQTGACCTGTTCREMCSFECEAIPNSVFSGVGTDCTPNRCKGACCLDGTPGNPGSCLDRTEEFCLNSVPGDYRGDGTTCATLGRPILDPPNPPIETTDCGGACCFGFFTQDQCEIVPSRLNCTEEALPNARYRGDGALCPSNCLSPAIIYGACCIADAVCIMTTQLFCVNASWLGGVYRGDNSTCDDSTCSSLPVGGCCYGNGTCVPGVPRPDCVSSGGTYRGDGTSCSPICPQPVGACCVDADCQNGVPPALCALNDGVYHGTGSTCQTNNPCPGPVGACCFLAEDNCRQLTQISCLDQGGMFRNVGVSCSVCPEAPGACCLPNGTCMSIRRTACEDQAGVFIGVGLACMPGQCEAPQACCFSDGPCEDLVQGACMAEDGEPKGVNTNCLSDPCPPPPTGSCCYQDGRPCVATLTGRECEMTGGFYIGNSVQCSACPAPAVGACCLPTFTCIETTQVDCVGPSGGVYRGHNSQCETSGICPTPPPTGACCVADGRCLIRTSTQCQELPGSTYHGNNTSCGNNPAITPCDDPPNDLCVNATGPLGIPSTSFGTTQNAASNDDLAGTCAGVLITTSGVWFNVMGNGNTLTASLCDTVSTFDTKISVYCRDCADPLCVFANDDICGPSGFQSTVSWCSETGILYRILVHGFNQNVGPFELDITSNATACTSTVNCIPLGACCFTDRACQTRKRTDCLALGGTFGGDDTACNIPSICPAIGACCLPNTSCAERTDAACIAQGGDPLDERFPTCSNADCSPLPTGACCLPNGTCEPFSRNLCINANGEYQGAFTDCVSGLCPLPRACCFPANGSCTTVLATTCTAQGGVPQSELAVCSPTLCPQPPRGACCLVSGQCLPNSTAAECGAASGTFMGADSICGEVVCEVARGACCVGISCSETTQQECVAHDGRYQGDGMDCIPILCLSIISSGPPANSIDAGQPHPLDPPDPNQGVTSVILGFDAAITGVMTANDFLVGTIPIGPAPSITMVETFDNAATLTLSEPIPPGRWTIITYAHNLDSFTCLGALPGDVDTNRTVDGSDADALISCLMDSVQCRDFFDPDVDRSGQLGVLDLARLMELMIGSGEYDPWSGQSLALSPCDEPTTNGACCMGTSCEVTFEVDCVSGGGVYRGDGTECYQPGPCISIVASNPPTNIIDARQPHPIDDADISQGIIDVWLTFDGSVGGIDPSHFSVTSTPTGPVPTIVSVGSSEFVSVHFDRPIPPGSWTTITYLPSGSKVCLGYLPGDVNGNQSTTDADVTSDDLLDIMECFTQVCELERADIDRNGDVNIFDLLRLLDLLNGAEAFIVWNGATLPDSPCEP
ncbi:MAG: hypothetical protein AABZ47_10950 [Planctomycetota bacterium]